MPDNTTQAMVNMKQFLTDNGLKQVDLARFLGITEASVSKMVKGYTNPSKENLQRILDNDRGWDTSSLLHKGGRNGGEIRELKEENKRLKDEVNRLLTIIERLTAVTPSSLQPDKDNASY